MQELVPSIRDLALMLGVASVAVVLFQKLRQPVILGYLLAGIIIGPHTPPYSLVTDVSQIHTLSELGVIFLMFAIGLDFSFHKLKSIGFSAITTGIFKIVLLAVLGFYAGQLLHRGVLESWFFGAAIAISSTTIILKALEDLNLKGKRFADMVLGILIVEDLMAVLMLTSLASISTPKSFSSYAMLLAAIKLILVIGSWFVSGYFLVPLLFRRIAKYVSHETLTIVSIALCLAMAVLAAYFHYSAALGAFIMGSILAETPLAKRIHQLVSPLRDLFAAVFFISVGMLIDFHVLIEHWQIVLGLSLSAVIARIVITSVGTLLTGQSLNTTIRASFSMAPIGEFSFIIMGLGLSLKIVDNSLYQLVTGMAAITTLVAPYLMRWSKTVTNRLDVALSPRTKYFLESYSAWVYRNLAVRRGNEGYRKFLIRLISSAIFVALIFKISDQFAFPQIIRLVTGGENERIYSWAFALFCSSPFIWSMLFGCELVDKRRRLPAVILGWLVTAVELLWLSIAYFNTWYIPSLVVIFMAIFLWLSYRKLEKSYRWFERQLVGALKQRQRKRTQYEELAPWDTHIVEIRATNDAPGSVVGKTLNENLLRQKFGINVVAIRRGSKIISAPRGEERILANDELMVLGNDEQLEAFRACAEDSNFEAKRADILKEFTLHALPIEDGSPYINKSIRQSNLREETHGLVVGLERDGFRILNPDPSMPLQLGDLVLIVGKNHNSLAQF